jgi:hypothetical protein
LDEHPDEPVSIPRTRPAGTADRSGACSAARIPVRLHAGLSAGPRHRAWPISASVLREASPSLRLRAVIISADIDRDWLDPGGRLDHALGASEGVLCLYNQLDPILAVHPFGRYSDQRRALGKSGMSDVEQQRLGSLAGRYCQQSIALQLGPRHTFRRSTENQVIVGWMRAYTWAERQ